MQQKRLGFSPTRWAFVALLAIGLSACAGSRSAHNTAPTSSDPLADAHYKIGKPYQVSGTWYYPQEDFEYVETGISSWYGPGFHGKKTANGEIYDQMAMTAAHRTLPLPSVVRVTNLKNGRSVVLRVNDRGPFAKERIIDVSQAAAQKLGFEVSGTAQVRVEILPAESRHVVSQLKEPGVIAPPAVPVATVQAQSLDAPSGSQVATQETTTQYARLDETETATMSSQGTVQQGQPEDSDIFVQVGAFGAIHNAERLKARISSLGPTKISKTKTGETYLFRVRVGPVDTVNEADHIVSQLKANDFHDVQIVLE